MTWFKKYGILIILLLIAAVVAIYFLFFRGKNISFDFAMGGNAATLLSNLQSRVAAGDAGRIGAYMDVPLTTTVNNQKAGAIVMQNISGSISYENEPILQTKANSAALQNVRVEGKSSTPVTDSVQVLVNMSTIKFFSELVKGNKPKVLYNFSTIIFGKPENFTNQTTIS